MIIEFLNEGIYNINGKYLKTNRCRFKSDGTYAVLFFPAERGLPVAVKIKMSGGKILPFSEGEFYDMGTYLKIKLEERPVREYIPLKEFFKERFSVRGEIHTATVLYDGSMRLIMESKNKTFNKFLPPLKDINIGNHNSVFLISGDLKDEIYLCVINYDASENEYGVLFEKTVDSFKVTEKGIICKKKLYGMLNTVEECLYGYKDGVYSLLNRNFRYRTPHIYPKKFYPVLFLESVKNKDYDLAESLVTDELKKDIKSVDKYLGEYIISDCEGKVLNNEPEVLFKEKGIYYKSNVKFETENGKISNISKIFRKDFLLNI